jgi:hypothetical protein
MSQTIRNHRIHKSGLWSLWALLVILLSAASCRVSQRASETPAQKTFASPEEAEAAVIEAAKAGDQSALMAIFGRDSKAILFTGDTGTDQARLNEFVTAYHQMHRWKTIKAGGQVLVAGAENIPFPIPLAKNSSGRWYFDAAAGKDEILARRIGKNELTAMDASQAIAGAEREYFQQRHDDEKVKQYAQKFLSEPGKKNGLYWPVAAGQAPSPLGRLGDFAQAASATNAGSDPEFNGYRYRILSKDATPGSAKDYIADGRMTGGFAILAYPADYRNSGIMSFLVGEDGTLYQKDLGENTAEVATAFAEYNPANGWTPVVRRAGGASRSQP